LVQIGAPEDLDVDAAARVRGRTGGQKPKLGPRQVRLARQMYDELGEDGKRRATLMPGTGRCPNSRWH
jgi:hypothetical protein